MAVMQRLLQFTLDLFEPASAHSTEKQSKKTEKTDFQVLNKPTDQQMPDQTAPEKIVDAVVLPIQTLQQALAPATFVHPRASRQTLLDGIAVA